MLNETMLALRVTDMEYAPEICAYLKAAEKDLKMAGVVPGGTCSFDISVTTNPETGEDTVTVDDNSTITDEAVQMAMITYVRMHFGSPADYDKLSASYDLQRRQLANATGYTDFLEPEEPEEPETAGEAETGEPEPSETPGTEEPGAEEPEGAEAEE